MRQKGVALVGDDLELRVGLGGLSLGFLLLALEELDRGRIMSENDNKKIRKRED